VKAPFLFAAIAWIGHPHIRNRGTIGASLARADLAAELPALTVALAATFTASAAYDSDIEPPADVHASAMPRILCMLQPAWCARLWSKPSIVPTSHLGGRAMASKKQVMV
jgi:FAD binding domain in molybdopterin dehydrogenase